MIKLHPFFVCLSLFSLSSLFASDKELLVNGGFESGSIEPGWAYASKWVNPDQVTVIDENGGQFLRITNPEPAATAISQSVPLSKEVSRIHYSGRIRGENIQPDEANWTGARLGLQFRDAQGKRTGAWPETIRLREDTDGWQSFEFSETVPQEATELFVEVGMWKTSGTADFADLSIQAEMGGRLTGEEMRAARFKEVLAEYPEGPLPLDASQVAWGMRPIPDPQPVTGAPEFDETSFDADWRIAPEGGDFSTFADALEAAEKKLSGGMSVRLRVAPGLYRERGLSLEAFGDAAREALLVIEAEKTGTAILSGSTVYTDWEKVQDDVWQTTLAKPIGPSKNAWGNFKRREMVFVNDTFIPQVRTVADLAPNTFAVSEDDRDILLQLPAGMDPNKLKVEIADYAGGKRDPILDIDKPTAIIRGLVLQHSNQHLHNAFALRTESNTLVENVTIRWNNSGGHAARGENVTLRNNDISDNGGIGLFTWRARNHLIEGCKTNRNNWRGLQADYTSWSQGGIKYHYIEHVLIRNHEANNNHCPGIWFDLFCYHITLENVQMNGNDQEMGFYWEASRYATFRNCEFNNNAEGVRLMDAGEAHFIDCTFAGNVVAVSVYATPTAPNGGTVRTENYHGGDNAGRFMGVDNNTFENCTFNANASDAFLLETAPRISDFISYVSPGYPTFFWANPHDRAAVPFFSTLKVPGSTFEAPREKKFIGPSGQPLDRQAWDKARATGWQLGGDWGTPVGEDGTLTLTAQKGNVFNTLPGFTAPANTIPLMSALTDDKGEPFLRVVKPLNPSFKRVFGHVRLQPGTKEVTVTTTTRMPAFEHGPKNWQRARLEVRFYNDAGEQVGKWSEMNWDQVTSDWQTDSKDFEVPENAAVMKLDFRFHGHGATFDIKQVEITAKDS